MEDRSGHLPAGFGDAKALREHPRVVAAEGGEALGHGVRRDRIRLAKRLHLLVVGVALRGGERCDVALVHHHGGVDERGVDPEEQVRVEGSVRLPAVVRADDALVDAP